MRPSSAPPVVGDTRSRRQSTFEAIRQHRHDVVLQQKARRKPPRSRKLTESERAFQEYDRTQRRQSLEKWQLLAGDDVDDSVTDDDENEEDARDEYVGDASHPPQQGRRASHDSGLFGKNNNSSSNNSNSIIAAQKSDAPTLSTTEASRLMERQIEARENIIHLLLGGDEKEPPLRQTLSFGSFTAAVRPFTASSAISRPDSGTRSPSPSPEVLSSSPSSSSYTGGLSLVEAKRQLTAQISRSSPLHPRSRVPTKVQNAWHCDDGSDEDLFDVTLKKSSFQTLSLFQHRPVATRLPANADADDANQSSQKFIRPVSAPLQAQAGHRFSPVQLVRSRAVQAPVTPIAARVGGGGGGGGKTSLQAMLAQQAKELSALEDKRRRYDIQTAAYLSQQSGLHSVLGAVSHGAWGA